MTEEEAYRECRKRKVPHRAITMRQWVGHEWKLTWTVVPDVRSSKPAYQPRPKLLDRH